MCPLLTVLDFPYGRKGIHFNHGTHCLLTLGILALSLGLFTLLLGGAVWACISGLGTCTQLLPVLCFQALFPECLPSPILTHCIWQIWQIYFPAIPSSYQQSCPRALNISSLFAILRIRSALTSGTVPYSSLLPIRKQADWEQLAQTQAERPSSQSIVQFPPCGPSFLIPLLFSSTAPVLREIWWTLDLVPWFSDYAFAYVNRMECSHCALSFCLWRRSILYWVSS